MGRLAEVGHDNLLNVLDCGSPPGPTICSALQDHSALALRQTLKRLQAVWNDVERLFIDGVDGHFGRAE
jgi:hypothetical protein